MSQAIGPLNLVLNGHSQHSFVARLPYIVLCGLLFVGLLREGAHQLRPELGAARQSQAIEKQERPLILYAYHDTDEAYDNARFFIQHGLHGGADFVFIQIGEGRLEELLPPTLPNVAMVQRENECYDLGSYGRVLDQEVDGVKRRDRYSHFILLNASLRGPMLPYWAIDTRCWSNEYIRKLNRKTKLVGLSINCQPDHPRHVQSMLLTLDKVGLEVLMHENGFLSCPTEYNKAIELETSLAQQIKEAGYREDVMMMGYHQTPDWRLTCETVDMLFEGNYFGFDMHPFEGLFIKYRRGYDPVGRDAYSRWYSETGFNSSLACDPLYEPMNSK